ncbi:pullulanase [Mycobacterium sp. ACS4331]|uniref:pullulanase n=1 Tax=Mycobacterium sp. ACS4331 TaxID=1834121 RepID=UPI0008007814|nr:pullulanase [Mycobacterium sp. ACS4331]OBF13766.1 pullulanase [Mycobacterium sp. ACS4331]
MDYCLGAGDGTASMLSGGPDVDLDGDGVLDAVALDFDGDGLHDDVLADLDDDGVADHAVLDHAAPDAEWFTDDGSGTWAVATTAAGSGAAQPSGSGSALRWQSLDGVEQTGGPLVDFDADGDIDDRLLDSDGDGLADRVIAEDRSSGYVDTDGDGRMDVKLVDTDGDGLADDASQL